MVEELSPESKLYLKEELEKVRNEFKEGLKDAQSKTTKIFTTIALIVGLLASMGIYGLVKDYMKTTIQTNVKTAIDEKLDEESVAQFEKRKGEVEKNMNEAEGLVEKLEQSRSEVEQKINMAEGYLEEILNLKKIANLPIGTIIASMLDPNSFAESVADTNRTTWVLADGRDVKESGYCQLTGSPKTPDLRGMFLRGVNKGRSDADPEINRTVGSYQADAFKSHKHKLSDYRVGAEDAGKRVAVLDPSSKKVESHTMSEGFPETRPKNVAVYFYIKIN